MRGFLALSRDAITGQGVGPDRGLQATVEQGAERPRRGALAPAYSHPGGVA